MEKQVLTQEEIQSLKNIQNNQSSLIEQLGIVEYRILILEKEKEKLKQTLQNQLEEEEKIGKQLQQKYENTFNNMAETLVSPGVLASEIDTSFVTQGPIQAGAAIIGPTVKGPVEIPTLVTSWSDYQNKFGTTFVKR